MVKHHHIPLLHPGDHIAIISPSGKITKSKLSKGINAIKDRGFQIDYGKYLYSQHSELAGEDDLRLHDLLWAFRDPSVRAIFCSRGGYGSSRLLTLLARRGIGNIPKLVVGFSDTTALQWALWTLWHLPSLSGPLASELGGGLTPEAEEAFWKTAQGNSSKRLGYGNPIIDIVHPGEVQGILMPGCLSIICTLIGTPFMPDLSGAILVIEDIGETPFRIDRMLVQLKNAGIFEQIGGLIIGKFLKSDAKTEAIPQDELRQRLAEILGDFQGPVVFGIPYGHGRDRWTLPVGLTVRFATDPFTIGIL